jgi:EmrB/QacA subfamily drug resistance transporter
MSAKGSNRALVIAAVMASMAMIAIEATIVATAMPQIAAELGDINLYSWTFSSFLLAQTATTIIFGRLADIYGRKPVLLVGIAIFLVGTIFAGFAQSMHVLIAFRLLQGLGAGAIQPVAMTVVADLYPLHERGKVQGYLASVWAVSAVVGPLAGSIIVEAVSWSWVFWVNIPVGILAATGFIIFLREDFQSRDEKVDVMGAVLFSIAVGALMIGLTNIEQASATYIITAGAVFLVALALFIWQEIRTTHPMLSLDLWLRRPIASSNTVTFIAGMAMIGLTTFLPIYIQTVLGRSALVAGLTLSAMLLGWPAAATFAARSFRRIGIRPLMITGSVFVPLGCSLLLILTPGSSPLVAAAGSLIVGVGMGLTSISALMLIQASAGRTERGSATASNIFSRNLGSTLGASLFGAVLNYGLLHSTGGASVTAGQLQDLLNRTTEIASAVAPIRAALQDSLHLTFGAMVLIACCTIIAGLFVPSLTKASEGDASRQPGQ